MKLSDLKVGDKFRFKECGFFDGTHVVTVAPGKEEFEDIQDAEVELITDPPEPQYRPYSDLRVLVGKTIVDKGLHRLITQATEQTAWLGPVLATDAVKLLESYTHLDGTPCGELVSE